MNSPLKLELLNALKIKRTPILLVLLTPVGGMIIALIIILMNVTKNREIITGLIIFLICQYVVLCFYIYKKMNKIKIRVPKNLSLLTNSKR